MTGAGSATVAFAHEASLAGDLVDTPEYYKAGRNATVTDLELSNTLERLREGDSVEAVDSMAQNLEGAVSVDAVVSSDVHAEVEQFVFNDSGSGFTSGLANSTAWYMGVDYIGGTAERKLGGTIPLDYSIDYEQGGLLTYSLTMAYATEESSTSITPSSIVGPSDGNDVPFHGFTLDIDGTTVAKLQSASLSISDIARYQWGADRTPVDAVLAAPETSLDAAAIFEGPGRLELGYGGSGSTTPQDTLSSVAGSVELSAGGSTVSTYTLPKLKPDTYSWEDLIAADEDLTDPTSFHVNGGVEVA